MKSREEHLAACKAWYAAHREEMRTRAYTKRRVKLPPPEQISQSDKTRFWNKVDKSKGEDACWEWQAVLVQGYGQFCYAYRGLKAHRFAWWITVGPIPDEIDLLHTCDNRRCCNPKHLVPGTQSDNNKDRDAKGRQAKGTAYPQSKLTEEQVKQIREMYATGSYSQTHLGKMFGISQNVVSSIVRRKRWKHID